MNDEVSVLIGRCRQGDNRAVSELVRMFADQVFGLCFRMLGHRQDAEDVAQESFVRAIRSLHTWDSTRDFRPWLLAIAGNRCRTWLANRKSRPVPSEEVEQLADSRPDESGVGHLNEELERALEQLRPEYRQAFLLFHRGHLSYAEIAEALACPIGTVRTWVHRARQDLADRLRRRGVIEDQQHAMRRI
ncbi:MAG: sigma-70 family RNA polymerase sigma factor [Planctomycetaceae bacterium]|nr:sigma-70 family RNA polymerase sigma factor [Planctomycetaceae bacterium]